MILHQMYLHTGSLRPKVSRIRTESRDSNLFFYGKPTPEKIRKLFYFTRQENTICSFQNILYKKPTCDMQVLHELHGQLLSLNFLIAFLNPGRETDRETETERRDKQTDKQTDRQTDRQAGSQTDRQTERNRERQRQRQRRRELIWPIVDGISSHILGAIYETDSLQL